MLTISPDDVDGEALATALEIEPGTSENTDPIGVADTRQQAFITPTTPPRRLERGP